MSMFGEWFTEDEDDMFMGSPKSKFFDVSREASQDVVEEEWDKIVEKVAILEMMLSEGKDENYDINEVMKEYKLNNEQLVNNMKKGLYVEFTGEIICRLDA
ncbi:DUF2018 family protein [Poseidonibacter lekithochrous]|uniref:DUF2018 family protein n=1 Tax=Poseidonibacter lekithochrous TaxID=1904463 RepID=UPI0008FC6D68|nr:DUF2018 family protein [Poseidonibacter lekithochrous]QKJ21933.1 DUF2018 domain-containing protein [Poseidonibacter lekithochrous]